MGMTPVEGVVTGPTERQATARLLIDSGATYSSCRTMSGGPSNFAQAACRLHLS